MVRSLDQAGTGQTRPPSSHRAGPSGGTWSSLRTEAGTFVRRHKLGPYLLILPALAGVGAVILWPTVQIAVFSFQNDGADQIAGILPTQWVGFANYTTILTDPEFYTALRNSVFFAIVVVPLSLVVGTGVALLLNRLGRKMATFVSMVTMVAWATPTIAATVTFYWIFNANGGLVDWALARLPGWLGGGAATWTGFNWTTSSALPVYTVLTMLLVWQGFPFIAVSVLAGLKTVPTELYEAARVDGATPWRVFWKVTFPLLKPIFLLMTLLSVIWDFGVFPQLYVLTGSGANLDEWNLGIYAYQHAFTTPANYSVGGAGAFILTGLLLIVTVGYVRSSIKQGALT